MCDLEVHSLSIKKDLTHAKNYPKLGNPDFVFQPFDSLAF